MSIETVTRKINRQKLMLVMVSRNKLAADERSVVIGGRLILAIEMPRSARELRNHRWADQGAMTEL